MSSEVPANPVPARLPRAAWLVVLLGFLCAVGYLMGYAGTPMGAHPVLDGKENLQLAADIADGHLPNQPFYRAPLYALMLSLGPGVGMPEAFWPDWARALNLAAWLISVWLVARLAGLLWGDARAAVLAAACWAFYPVGHFFAGDPLDVTLAIALMLGGLERAFVFWRSAKGGDALGCGFLLALAALARPQLWAVALAVPATLMALTVTLKNKATLPSKVPPRWPVFLAVFGVAIPALLMGWANLRVSGQFTVLPTQGPFNLWAANRPGAHGKYFAQGIELRHGERHMNPASLEAAWRYAGDPATDKIDTVEEIENQWRILGDYWRAQFWSMVAEDPVGLTGRVARKALYLANNYEQYNNKTYAVHRELSPWLRWNPLGWGVLLVAVAPLLVWSRSPVALRAVWVAAVLAYAVGLLATYVSARFRLPLVPLLAVVAGGWAVAPWRSLPRGRLVAGVALAAFAAVLAFYPFPGVREPDTTAQDYLLLGYAALEAGDDAEALTWARRAVEQAPGRNATRELLVVAEFNVALARLVDAGELPGADWLETRSREADALAAYSPSVNYIAGMLAWWRGADAAARARWDAAVSDEPLNGLMFPVATQDALAALLMTGPLSSEAQRALAKVSVPESTPRLRAALVYALDQPPETEAQQALLEQMRRVFAPGVNVLAREPGE